MPEIPTPPIYSIQEAKKLGYRSITIPFKRSELELLTTMLLGLVGIDHCLIETGTGLEVARKHTEVL